MDASTTNKEITNDRLVKTAIIRNTCTTSTFSLNVGDSCILRRVGKRAQCM